MSVADGPMTFPHVFKYFSFFKNRIDLSIRSEQDAS